MRAGACPLVDTSNVPARAMEPPAHLSPHGARSVGKIGAETYSARSFGEAMLMNSAGEKRGGDPYVRFLSSLCAPLRLITRNHSRVISTWSFAVRPQHLIQF